MAQIIIDVNDLIAVDVRDTLCIRYGYTGVNTNPAKMAFLKTVIAARLKQEYIEQKIKDSQVTAGNSTYSSVATADIT